MVTVDCEGRTTREINQEIKALLRDGIKEIRLSNPNGRHNLGVCLLAPVKLTIDGNAGYYAAGLCDGPEVVIRGNVGWGVAENLMAGTVEVHGNAGNAAAATLRGGTVCIHGDSGSRTAISMKGGVCIVEGRVGYMTGFMMQKGTLIVCGDADEGLGDSMYEGTIFVGGTIKELGNDAVIKEPTREELAFLTGELQRFGITGRFDWKKVVAGRRLWNFNKKELDVWKVAL